MSQRIRVRSVVGRFLEHSRIFWFANGDKQECYAGSADWMPRNLYERCEVIFPIADPVLLTRVRAEILEAYLRDDVKGRLMHADGTYTRPTPRLGLLGAQDWLILRSQRPAPKALPDTVPQPAPKEAAPGKPVAQAAKTTANVAAKAKKRARPTAR